MAEYGEGSSKDMAVGGHYGGAMVVEDVEVVKEPGILMCRQNEASVRN